MDAIKNIVLNTQEQALEDMISPFIQEQFPSFMRADYPKLILFIKAYYEWLESKGNAGYLNSKLDTIWDIDENVDEFYNHFKNTYLQYFPDLLAANEDGSRPNKKTLLKKIRDFYGNKGTESAYKFLFRILYDSDLEIYYPKSDILKVSDGVWVEPRSIKTTSTNAGNLFRGKNGQIFQYNRQTLVASAFVDSVIQYSFKGIPVSEFFITDINGTFLPNQKVRIAKDNEEWTETTYPVLGDYRIENGGSGYRVNDPVTVVDTNGTGFSAKIEQLGLGGSVKSISIANSGINYSADTTVNVFNEIGIQSARIVALRTAVTNYSGYFSGNRGKLSSNKRIQDGNYYQEFSYELKSEVSLEFYFSTLKQIIHPAGMKMFGSMLIKKTLENELTSSSQLMVFETPIIGKYTPYKFGTTLDLRSNGVTLSGYWLGNTGDLYPLGYNPYIGYSLDVGPNGKTTSVGTVFVGTSLGYTYCFVPEGGRTSHNPIGAALGSTGSWYLGREENYTIEGMNGLVLWLKPENIGVCGSVVTGACLDIWRDASPFANHGLPPTWDRWNTDPQYVGVTVDFLRPTLVINDNGIPGVTGLFFNGGPIFGPHTKIVDESASAFGMGTIVYGVTFATGSSGSKILLGTHFFLKNGLTLSEDANIFIVFRPSAEGLSYGLGLVSSSRRYTNSDFVSSNDYVLFSRSYNVVDRTPQLSGLYDFSGDTKLYPASSGLFGFNPYLPFETSTGSNRRTTVAYDPHVSGTSMGTMIGEAFRDSRGTIGAYVNGDLAINRSRATGLRVSNYFRTGAEFSSPGYTGTISIGRFGSYHIPQINTTSRFGGNPWVNELRGMSGFGFRGVINEVIVFNRQISETERQKLYGYLSRKYYLDSKLPDSYTQSHNSAYSFGLTFWQIENHPNTKGIREIPSGLCFSGITISHFLSLPAFLYKSKGTRLYGGTVLTGDTYSNIGL